ncbi:YdeI family protein [Jeotgalibacillus sp. R-1-5s-1]|uniref:YdeI/OmpD-associated family protein n=1 Tax=Jeotgalibacillus sp. R-1-5s-1 TaxID=2555897 RepID=UPI00106B1646|nr:hypothetical protein [Jeotgalibacillus sp. R-1-5s-1]TFE00858.1 hypothetical protein E2491_04940 [Jeotgalibacillus sp. R-1-5s-1]
MKTLRVASIIEWRKWLEQNHLNEREVWLENPRTENGYMLDYIETVEEAICFGWIDGIAKKSEESHMLQRFTPRKKNSNWTELNKERARRLIRLGKMHPSGYSVCPDLDEKSFVIQPEVYKKIIEDEHVKSRFEALPDLYKRVRIGYIQEFRPGHPEFERRLANFIQQTKKGKMYGNWNDGGKLTNED